MPRRKTTAKRRRLNAKQARFAEEYLIDMNATQAAIRSGYSSRTAGQSGFDLLKNPEIQRKIEEGREKLAKAAEVTAERVVKEVSTIAFSDIGEILDFDGENLRMRNPKNIPAEARRAISAVKVRRFVEKDAKGEPHEVELVEFKLHPKTTALQQLIDKLGLKAPTKIAPTDPSGEKEYSGVMVVPGSADAQPWESAAKQQQADLSKRTAQ